MSLGRAYRITVVIILMIPIAFQGALSDSPPSHENFEKAQEDLEILLALLEDSKVVSEETLDYFVHMEYSPENLSILMAKSNELHELLLGAELLYEQMGGEASSYEYLKEYLTSFQNLDLNISSLILFYKGMKENQTIAEEYLNDTASSDITADEAFESLNNTESNIEDMKNSMDGIENNTEAINEKGFSTITLDELIIESKQLIDSDENVSKELSVLFTGIPNYLSFYINKTDIALGDELISYGYFFANGDFLSGQNIRIFLDDQLIDEVVTNSTGRYEFKKEIPFNHSLGEFNIYTSTIYNNTLLKSDTIFFKVGKVPTKLTLSTQYSVYSPKQPIQFSGKLLDYRGNGLANENITFYFEDPLGNSLYFNNITITNLSTDSQGSYIYELNATEIPIGKYVARADFQSNEVYKGIVSEMIEVTINIPTNLILSILETTVYEGETITFFGQLFDIQNNTPLSNMTIEIYFEDQKYGEVVTNNLGQYEFVYSTLEMIPGRYNVHSEFNPIEVKWRVATSDVLEIEIKDMEEPETKGKSLFDRFYSNLFLIIILIIAILLPIVLYLTKKKSIPSFVYQIQPLISNLGRKSQLKETLSEKLHKETITLDNKLKELKETKNIRETIVAGYHTLLDILEKNKIISIKPSYTHLDIQKKLANEGFPNTEISSVTKIFEKAMYSNHPMESNTLDEFMIGVRKMFTHVGRTNV